MKPATKLDNADDLPAITLLLKDKQDNEENFEKVLTALQASGDVITHCDCITKARCLHIHILQGKVIGHFRKDKFATKFIDSWKAFLEKQSFEMVGIALIVFNKLYLTCILCFFVKNVFCFYG